MLRRLGKVFLIGVLVGLVLAAIRALTRPRPSDPLPPAPVGRSLSPPPRAEAAPSSGRVITGDTFVAVEEPDPEPEPDTTDDGERIIRGDSFVAVEPAPPHDLEPAPAHEVETTWTGPIDGECPPGFPIKAKLGSRIFHQPGGLSYERTRPDRCYPTTEAAEADGFRAAKR